MKRIQIRIGDVFEVSFESRKKFFQFIGLDETQLNSEIIRAFKKEFKLSETPKIEDLVTGEVEFHAHTMIRLGYKMGLYHKVGNCSIDLKENVTWRQSEDSGTPGVEISVNWFTWKTGEGMKKYSNALQKLDTTELGGVHNPRDIVEKMKNGEFKYFHHRYK